jgi:hypothetical protein
MEAGATTAFGACAAETCERACNQYSSEKNLHVVSLPKAARRHIMRSMKTKLDGLGLPSFETRHKPSPRPKLENLV